MRTGDQTAQGDLRTTSDPDTLSMIWRRGGASFQFFFLHAMSKVIEIIKSLQQNSYNLRPRYEVLKI